MLGGFSMKKIILLILFFSELIVFSVVLNEDSLSSNILKYHHKNRNIEFFYDLHEKFSNAESFEEAYTILTQKDVGFLFFISAKDTEEIIYIYNNISENNFKFISEDNKLFYNFFILDFFKQLPLETILKIRNIIFLKKAEKSNDRCKISAAKFRYEMDKGYILVGRKEKDVIYGYYAHSGLWGDISDDIYYKQIYTASPIENGTCEETVFEWQDYKHVLALKYKFEINKSQKDGLVEFGVKFCKN
jgi:hypothetical protein